VICFEEKKSAVDFISEFGNCFNFEKKRRIA
jgi:hypothetical protein